MADITILRADITTLDVDAVVNAANRQLAGGGGLMEPSTGPLDQNCHRHAGSYAKPP
ncbi:ADP-ribose binding module [Cutibacterium acnes JCM 18918]|nr:ADP-ribose binding module [Cutibacterium acnes JCM 18918]